MGEINLGGGCCKCQGINKLFKHTIQLVKKNPRSHHMNNDITKYGQEIKWLYSKMFPNNVNLDLSKELFIFSTI